MRIRASQRKKLPSAQNQVQIAHFFLSKKKTHHRKLLDLWSNSAIHTRLDKRSLQQESDLHRLFLLTEHRERVRREEAARSSSGQRPEGAAVGGEEYARALSAEAQALGPRGTAEAVQRRLLAQALAAARALHAALVEAGDSAAIEAEERGRGRRGAGGAGGLAAAVGGDDERGAKGPKASSSSSPSPSSSPPPPLALIAERLSESLGYSLRVSPSSIPGAGDGVFVEEVKSSTRSGREGEESKGFEKSGSGGSVDPGTLALLYPGVAYPPLSYRSMAGYPRVDKGSDYLAARYDGVVLDAVAWGAGGGAEGAGASAPPTATTSPSSSFCSAFAPPRPRLEGAPRPSGPAAAAEALLSSPSHSSSSSSSELVEARNPLALAHLVNHPPEGQRPNVAVASFDVPLRGGGDLEREPWLRRYFPVVVVGQGGGEAEEKEDENKRRSFSLFGEPRLPPPPAFLPCLGLVALSRIEPGAELLLNYRLSSRLKKPEWYCPVDPEEESRRWA